MSSLLQFKGKISPQKGVGLEFYLVGPNGEELELDICPICGEKHPRLYRFWRKPAGLFGHWVVFRYLGKEQIPDLSVPLDLERKPRGSEQLPLTESCQCWHRT